MRLRLHFYLGSAMLTVLFFVCMSGSVCFGARSMPVDDNYIFSGSKKVAMKIRYDQMGVLTRQSLQKKTIMDIESAINGRLQNEFPGNLFVFGFEKPMPGENLAMLAREIEKKYKNLVRKAGLVTKPEKAEVPMILTDEIVVQFLPGVDEKTIDQLIDQYAMKVVRRSPFVKTRLVLQVKKPSSWNTFAVSNDFRSNKPVQFAHPDFIAVKVDREMIPNDPLFPDQWHHRNTGQGGGTVDADVDTSLAWDLTTGNENVVIAVIEYYDPDPDYWENVDVEEDCLVDIASHPDLNPNIWSNSGEIAGNGIDDDGNGYIDDTNGWDFAADSGSVYFDRHGISAAGCAVARGNNAEGVSGSCPTCNLMPIAVNGSVSTDADAFDYARAMGADIINNSWGYAIGTPFTEVVETAIVDAATLGREGLGSVVFFAMTNWDQNNCIGETPDISSIENVIAVSRSTYQDGFYPGGWGDCMDVLGPTRDGTETQQIVTTDCDGYRNDFGGTSAATPIIAGIAGLVLDRNPELTRLQVQRLLQDTADKIEDSAAGYRPVDGFSRPGGGASTHGYGRVNAFEAVRLVSPFEDGGKDGVDIMLRDNRLDWGNTEQPSNVLFEPTRGFIPHWQSVDIKIDAPPFEPLPPATSSDFDAMADENPIENKTNLVYVRVRNRGPVAAENVTVKLHWTFAGTALPALPADFWSEFPDDSTDTSVWHPLGVQEIETLDYCGASVAGSVEDAARIVQFEFHAPAIDPAKPNPRHHCLLAVIDTKQDPVSDASKGSLIVDWITPRDNNVTHKNVQLQDAESSRDFKKFFYVWNPYPVKIETLIGHDLKIDWKVDLDGVGFNEKFSLKPGERRLMSVSVHVSKLGDEGEFTIYQKRVMGKRTVVMGGITFIVKSDSKKTILLPPENLRIISSSLR